MNIQPLLSIKNLSKTFSNGYKALNNISFDIYESQFLIIAGRNGSGKTLLVKHLTGLENPTSGDIFYNNISIYSRKSKIHGQIGLIFQDADSQILGETVWDDIAIGPRNLKYPKSEINLRVAKALEWAQLVEKKDDSPISLSGGEKRRLSIAGMLAMDCRILIFDEPFANLDYPSIVHVLTSLIKLKDEGKTVIVLTHELEKVLAYADRLVILDQGEIKNDVQSDVFNTVPFQKYGLRNPFSNSLTLGELTWL